MLLENGRTAGRAIDWVIAEARTDPELVAGFDFAFSFPRWFCEAHGWSSGPEVWAGVAEHGEDWLGACTPPFWGRRGHPRPHPLAHGLRVTEQLDARGAKSVFQIGGSGAVGTGSLRGMPHLLTLRDAGFAVWPFTGSGRPAAIEIYPRAMYGHAVRKSRASDRRALLEERFADQDPGLLALAASSEDAFDAAVSALVMAAHADDLAALAPQPDPFGLEGRVWVPTPPAR